jgi:beta-mannosidase
MHFYDYTMDCEDDSKFPAARFVSEFGFQSQPSFETYRSVLNKTTDYFKDSEVLKYRQRHEGGNEEMEA